MSCRLRLGLGLSAAIAFLVCVGLLLITNARQQPVEPGSTREVPFTVEPGSSLGKVAHALEEAGLVRDAGTVVWLARYRGWESTLKAGEYLLSPGWTTAEVLEPIVEGRVRTYAVVLPEGIRASEVAERLEQAGLTSRDEFIRVVRDAELAKSLGVQAPSLEGYLHPETYQLPKGLPAPELARILVEGFDASWREIEAAAKAVPLTKHQIVTLASIVEKETGVPEERPLIAAVFLNRLRRGMRLETDPSVIYGIEDFDGNLRKRDLQNADNPYNTYLIAGLPPGPIANPGIDALRAVVQPARTEYLFFVSRNDGTHEFSRSYREHVNAVNRYQKRRASRKAPSSPSSQKSDADEPGESRLGSLGNRESSTP